MNTRTIKSLTEEDAIDRIVETVMTASPGHAPFALVIGAGFSRGLVPTARELVTDALPLWITALRTGQPLETLRAQPAAARAETARVFWKEFCEANAGCGLELRLDSHTGLPEDYAAAYKACFDPNYQRAVGEPATARRFQREFMRLDRPRLNAAHFLLASLLGVQPGRSRPSELFKARAAFCRLILTTNFDPFLQTALQSANRLYFMSDTPELGVSDEIFDDPNDAIHLVYLHGTVHRRLQAASEQDIENLKQRNARTLRPALRRRGVIVLGYSGWDDVIVEALTECDGFDHRLYWLGLKPDPLAPGAYGPRVAEVLRKPAAYYVQTTGAGPFMAKLCTRLVNGLPRLLENPIAQLRELLEAIDLKGLEDLAAMESSAEKPSLMAESRNAANSFVQAKESALDRLREAEKVFLGESIGAESEGAPAQGADKEAGEEVAIARRVEQLASAAGLAAQLGKNDEAIALYTKALEVPGIDDATAMQVRLSRGVAYYFAKRLREAVQDFTVVSESKEAESGKRALALVNRAVAQGRLGETEKQIEDYGAVLAMPDAPAEQRAKALVNRGVAWRRLGETGKAIEDYDAVIAMSDAPDTRRASALNNRGWMRYTEGDYTAFERDIRAAMEADPSLSGAKFNYGLALLALNRDAEALEAYGRAAAETIEGIDEVINDLHVARASWLSEERAAPVLTLLEKIRGLGAGSTTGG